MSGVSRSVISYMFAFKKFGRAGGECVSWCLLIGPSRFSLSLSVCLSLSLVLLYAVWTRNNKCLLIFDGEFLFLSRQHPGNVVPTDHPPPRTVNRSSVWIVSFPILVSFKHCVGAEKIDKQTIQKHIWCRTKRYCYNRCLPNHDPIFDDANYRRYIWYRYNRWRPSHDTIFDDADYRVISGTVTRIRP